MLTANLSQGCLILPDHPVRDLRIEGVAPEMYTVDEEDGLILASLEPHNFQIYYQVGNEIDELPVYAQELIKKIIQYQLAPNLVEEGEIKVLTETGRNLRTRKERDRRRHAETLRTTTGEGFLQPRSC